MGIVVYLDSVLIPVSVFIMVGYHAHLWHTFKRSPSYTSIGAASLMRKSWFLSIKQGDVKAGMLVVQSLRNTLMRTIFSSTISILLNISLAALLNNTYNAAHIFNITNPIFGSQSGAILVMKFGSASFCLLSSFFCSSMAVGFLLDANFMVNSGGCFPTERLLERGYMLCVVGNRFLCMAFPMLFWMFGPLFVVFSSLGLVWFLNGLDFVTKTHLAVCN